MVRNAIRSFVFLPLVAGLLACAGVHHTGPITDCEAEGPARPLCLGFQNPEDLVALPGGEAILVSEYGGMEGGRAGRLSTLDLASETRRVVFEPGDAEGVQPIWGDPACPGAPAKFSPHGIHLSRRENGALQLLVVQHDGRESVEFFEVIGAGTGWQVAWRGCVVAPDDAWLNSVAALPGGGFVTTHMMPRDGIADLQEAFARGDDTGYVLEWLPGQGFEILGGSRSAMPNGIETSSDGTLVYLNASGSGEVRRIERATGTVQAIAPVGHTDNARWASDGRLVVAQIGVDDATSAFETCMALTRGACPIGFAILAIDPGTMESEELYANDGPPMGGGTVGLVIGDDLFVGSFAGDRILRISLD